MSGEARFGCYGCGAVFLASNDCGCITHAIDLPTAADVLAFKLRMSGRPDEAVDVEDLTARLQEHS